MAHEHHHGNEGSSHVEQLCILGVCGALGGVAVVLWYREKLSFLHPNFRIPVLLGGLALLGLVCVRAMIVWRTCNRAVPTKAHRHVPGCGHDHGHAHSHGWGPWRYAVLLFPIMLFCLNLPAEGFSFIPSGNPDLEGLQPEPMAERGVLGREVRFRELLATEWNP